MKTRSFAPAVAFGLSLLLASPAAHAFGIHITRMDVIRTVNAGTMNTSSIKKTSSTPAEDQKAVLLDDSRCSGVILGVLTPLLK